MDANVETKPEQRVCTVNEAAVILRISRGAAYEAAKRKEIPTVRIGRRLLVPMAALERMLGEAAVTSAISKEQLS
jgi:excisionase family DNA binding protein